jgi:hypothetical protein
MNPEIKRILTGSNFNVANNRKHSAFTLGRSLWQVLAGITPETR